MRGKRYVVGIPKLQMLYAGNSRFVAWLYWFLNHKKGALAFDRRSWISNPAYWLTGDSPNINYFNQ